MFAVAVEHLGEGHDQGVLHTTSWTICSKLAGLFGFGWAKFNIAVKTHSPAMKKDAVCSLGGAVLSLGVLVGVGLFQSDDAIWSLMRLSP